MGDPRLAAIGKRIVEVWIERRTALALTDPAAPKVGDVEINWHLDAAIEAQIQAMVSLALARNRCS